MAPHTHIDRSPRLFWQDAKPHGPIAQSVGQFRKNSPTVGQLAIEAGGGRRNFAARIYWGGSMSSTGTDTEVRDRRVNFRARR
jgi:hypothetical protein